MKFSAESQDFDKQLKKRVTKEPIIWFFTPKVFDDKNFTGKFNDSNFNLSSNTYFSSLKAIRIKGIYKRKSENLYSIEYDVELSKGTKIFYFLGIFSFVFVMNFMIYKQRQTFEIFPNCIFLFFNVFILFVFSLFKRNIKKNFEKEFELKNIV